MAQDSPRYEKIKSKRYSSDSDDNYRKQHRDVRRRSSGRHRSSDRDGGRIRDELASSHRKRYRSPSPKDDRLTIKRRSRSASRSRERPRRDSRSDRRLSRRDRSVSRSPIAKHRYEDGREHRRPSERHRSRSHSRSPKRRRYTSRDRNERSNQKHDRRNSPPARRSPSPPPPKRSHAPLPSQKAAFTDTKPPSSTSNAVTKPSPQEPEEKQKPNYAPTGKLAAETNTVANTNIVLKYNEPPEARLPPSSARWRLYVFKGKDLLETLPLHDRSCWLFGRERSVVDFPTEHPSCSKQHAVLQFRYREKRDEWGEKKGGVKPYVIDLESANGTMVNGDRVPERRYVEVRSGDVMTLGESTREYVLMLPPKD